MALSSLANSGSAGFTASSGFSSAEAGTAALGFSTGATEVDSVLVVSLAAGAAAAGLATGALSSLSDIMTVVGGKVGLRRVGKQKLGMGKIDVDGRVGRVVDRAEDGN